ncbi:MAG: hypothetical protein WA729_19270, partial [Pseudolabrys sp.]
MQQTDQTHTDVGGQILCGLPEGWAPELIMLQSPPSSIETKDSWAVATVALVTMLMAFGAAWITAVALKDIAAEVNGARS